MRQKIVNEKRSNATLFDVYTRWDIEPVRAQGCRVWDKNNTEYLDFYGGHAVISIGHAHPKYVKAIQKQIEKLGFYSNAVLNSLQTTLAEKLGMQSGYPNYALFLCNSGAEANENALKIASFSSQKQRIIAFGKAFHGRTSGAVAITDNPAIQSPFNRGHQVTFLPINRIDLVEQELQKGDVAGVIIEGIQGVAGIIIPEDDFMRQLQMICNQYDVALIVDEIQSGYGRTGKFFAHQYAHIQPDIITMAKGMGNGFPIGGILISPKFKAKKGMLGTTFGGNHLACAAAIAVLDVLHEESLLHNAAKMGNYLQKELAQCDGIENIRGRGLMIGFDVPPAFAALRDALLFEQHIFTGAASNNVIRLLPPLCITEDDINLFIQSLKTQINLIQNK